MRKVLILVWGLVLLLVWPAAVSAINLRELPVLNWVAFDAVGYPQPVYGVVYRASDRTLVCGMPLGGLGTGGIDINPDGRLGRSSLFERKVDKEYLAKWKPRPRSHLPSINKPFLSIKMENQSYLLALDPQIATGVHKRPWWQGNLPDRPRQTELHYAEEIYYWGHYPAVDMDFVFSSAPFDVTCRCWSPFVPGDSRLSNTPGAVIEVFLTNTSGKNISGQLQFSIPLDTNGLSQVIQKPIAHDGLSGIQFNLPGDSRQRQIALAVADHYAIQPSVRISDTPFSISVPFDLEPGQKKTIPLLLGWHAQYIDFGPALKNKYTTRFKNAASVVEFLARERHAIFARIVHWQQAIYARQAWPLWLLDSLINIFHLYPEASIWFVEGNGQDNFSMIESASSDPVAWNPCCEWYGIYPTLMFFPELARISFASLSQRRSFDFQSYPHIADHMNQLAYAQILHRYWKTFADDGYLKRYYPNAKKIVTAYKTFTDHNDDGLPELRGTSIPNLGSGWEQFYDFWPWPGQAVHVSGMWMATLAAVADMAAAANDPAFALYCKDTLRLAQSTLEKNLWNEDTQSYLLYRDLEHNVRNETILANQLAGQWVADSQGLARNIFPADRIRSVLKTLETTCVEPTRWGIMGAIRPDGRMDLNDDRRVGSYGIYPAEALCTAMTLIYHDRQETGLKIAGELFNAITLQSGLTYDMPNIIASDTAEVIYGTDYFQMLILWMLPAALERQTLDEFCSPQGPAQRIITTAGG